MKKIKAWAVVDENDGTLDGVSFSSFSSDKERYALSVFLKKSDALFFCKHETQDSKVIPCKIIF